MTDEVELEPDRNRLHELVKLTWDTKQGPAGGEARPVTDEEIAAGGPYSVEQIREHLLAEQGDTYVLKRDEETAALYVLALQ